MNNNDNGGSIENRKSKIEKVRDEQIGFQKKVADCN